MHASSVSNRQQDETTQLIDRTGRQVSYIRLSVTDRCDLRCQYCMPAAPKFLPKADILTLEQLLTIASVFVERGVSKIRITGGEPLVRRNIIWLLERLSALPGVRETVMTTNGTRLRQLADDIKQAGVRRLNISIDTLDSSKFSRLTRTGNLAQVLDGFYAALEAGFEQVKINTVLMKGFNDDELVDLVNFAQCNGADISFIEEMPLGDCERERTDHYLDSHQLLEILTKSFSLTETDYSSGGPARYWDVSGSTARVGIIAPHSRNFCSSCNRVRITCTGDLFPCLGQNGKVALAQAAKAQDTEAISRGIDKALADKPDGHEFDPTDANYHVMRYMATTGG